MLAVWKACEKAKICIPEEVLKFFGGTTPDPTGVQKSLKGSPGVSKFLGDMMEGFEVDLRVLDPDIKILRFYNSY